MTSKISMASTPASCHQPAWYTGIMALVASLLSIMSTGVITGKPRMAMSAAFWPALAAMADRKVKTVERAVLPTARRSLSLFVLVDGHFT